MLWVVLMHLMEFVVDLVVAPRAAHAKDLEIALPQHQLWLLQRRTP